MGDPITYTNDPDETAYFPEFFSVWEYRPDFLDEDLRYKAMPNIEFLAMEFADDAKPPWCRFRYSFDDVFYDPSVPQAVEDVLPLDATGDGIATPDMRLVVKIHQADGSVYPVWDGFAQIPQADGGDREVVTFTGLGTPVREWDTPVGGAWYRNGSLPHDGAEDETYREARFNPDGKPNATPEGYDHGADSRNVEEQSTEQFPVFLDEKIIRDPEVRRHWTIAMAVRYLIFGRKLIKGFDIEKWVKFPDPAEYDSILESWEPFPDPNGDIDPEDPTTFTANPIRVQDLTLTRDPWPEAVMKLVKPHGFNARWDLNLTLDDDPRWDFVIYRDDGTGPTKKLKMQKAALPGESVPFDPARTDVAAFTVQRDGERLANQHVADGSLHRFEVSVVLAPLFEIDPDDVNHLSKWVIGGADFDPVKYRYYGVDETGDGHWDFATGAWVTLETPDFDPVFGDPDDDGNPLYAVLRRPAEGTLLTRNDRRERLPAELYVSADYAGTKPGVWDGTGTWQRVTMSGWEMLKDQLGIRLTRPDLENYAISHTKELTAASPFKGGQIRVITCMAKPSVPPEVTTPRFWFRLTAVISGDRGIKSVAERRVTSPGKYVVEKAHDYRGWFHTEIRHESSTHADPAKGTEVLKSDTDAASAQALALRKAAELGSMAGSVRLGRISFAYTVGDRVSDIEGRDISLRQNLGAGSAEAAVSPTVVNITWTNDQKQDTTLQLSDKRALPPPERRR